MRRNILRKFSTTLVFIIFLSYSSSYSQVEGPSTYKIANISTKGNKNYESSTIISYSGLVTGQEIIIPSDQTREAINRLWNIGIFSDVKIYVDKKFGNDIYIVIEVEELPRVEKVEITGNDEYSDDDLQDQINLVSGEILSEQKLQDIKYNLEKYYADEGYGLAKVKVDKLISANNDARVRIKIDEGNKLTVRNIIFEGNKSIPTGDLKSAMDETSEAVWWNIFDGATFDKKKYDGDKVLIENYYKENGFKDAFIEGDELVILPSKEDVNIKIKINEGKKYFVNDITFEGNTIFEADQLVPRIGFQKGEVYNSKKLNENLFGNESESDISSLYLDKGYLSFNAEVEEIPVDSTNKIDLKIKINEGIQFKFGQISFEGNDKTQDKVMRRELYTLPGDYFSKSAIKRSMQQLSGLNYFNPEKLSQDISLANDSTVNMKYLVEEKSSDQFNASVGYSGSYGVTGTLGLTFNNFDISQPFQGGAGQILSFNWTFGTGGTYRTFELGFQEPWLYNTPTQFGFNIFSTRQNQGVELKEAGASVNIGRRFKFPDDYFRGDWTLKFQNTDVINGDQYYQEGTRSQFSIRQIISRSTVFEPVFPTSGTKVSNSTEFSGGWLLPGSINFIKNVFLTEAYTPLSLNRKLVLFSNFQFSFVNSTAGDDYLPPTETFYMGGNGLTYNTIALRGYDDRSIGPKNSYGSPIGGTVTTKFGFELRYSLSQDPIPIFLLGFVEAGNVWNDINKTDPFDLYRSAGFGTRLILPAVGLVGFDFGYGFDRRAADGQPPAFLFHFQFGRGF